MISLITLATFLIFSWSCAYLKEETVVSQDLWEGEEREATIIKIRTHSGEIVDFLSQEPAKLTQDGIMGTVRVKDFHIEKTQVLDIMKTNISWRHGRTSYKLTTLDGKEYRLLSYKEKNGVLVCDALIPYKILYTDVDWVRVKVVDVLSTVLRTAVVGGLILIYIILSNDPPAFFAW